MHRHSPHWHTSQGNGTDQKVCEKFQAHKRLKNNNNNVNCFRMLAVILVSDFCEKRELSFHGRFERTDSRELVPDSWKQTSADLCTCYSPHWPLYMLFTALTTVHAIRHTDHCTCYPPHWPLYMLFAPLTTVHAISCNQTRQGAFIWTLEPDSNQILPNIGQGNNSSTKKNQKKKPDKLFPFSCHFSLFLTV